MTKRKQDGFSLVETLVVIGIVGLLLTILVIALNSKQKEIRDIKRVNDISMLRNAIEVVKNQNGGYDRMMCNVGIVSACASNNSDLSKYLLNLKTFNDPLEKIIPCANTADCNGSMCNYSFTKITGDDYEVRFRLEKGMDGFSSPGCYSATPRGITKL